MITGAFRYRPGFLSCLSIACLQVPHSSPRRTEAQTVALKVLITSIR